MKASIQLLEGRLHKGTVDSIGYDLYSTGNAVIWPGKRVKLGTGVRTKLANFVVGIIGDRSGLAANYGITVLAGIIDPDFDREWQVILLNTGEEAVTITAGDRIAQVIFMNTVQNIEVIGTAVVSVGAEARSGGFGSTGN